MSVTVKTVKDGRTFEMSIEAAKLSRFLANTIEEFGVDEALPIQGQVSGPTMEKVVAWCNIHASGSDEDDVEDRDEDFIQGLTQNEIFEVMLAANFLDIDPLVELAAKSIAMKSKGKTTEELRQLFNIQNDWTPEEEDIIYGRTTGGPTA